MRKRALPISYLAGLLIVGSVVSALGETNSPTASAPAINNRPIVVPATPPPARTSLPASPHRPPAPGQPVLSKDVKDLVRDFQSARQTFLKQQQELARKLQGANEADRAIIREQLKENLDQWKEQQKAQIQELRE